MEHLGSIKEPLPVPSGVPVQEAAEDELVTLGKVSVQSQHRVPP